jgi:hypothetical protein
VQFDVKHCLMKYFILIFTCGFLVTCAQKKIDYGNPNIFSPPKKLAELTSKKIEEASGLASSIANPGFLWTHNDSGNKAEVFLVDQQLNIKLTCYLQGVKNRDWEDITVGPGPDANKNYIYIADIGDNKAEYKYKIIYRFEEPVASDTTPTFTISNFDKIVFELDKKKDTESLMIDPSTKDLYVISKREKPVFIYKLEYPYSSSDTLTAKKVASLPFTQIVASDFSADGKELLMKNYEHVYYWNNATGKSIEELLKEKPEEIPYDIEPQGEAITFARDGSGFYTLSEKNIAAPSYLYFYKRK